MTNLYSNLTQWAKNEEHRFELWLEKRKRNLIGMSEIEEIPMGIKQRHGVSSWYSPIFQAMDQLGLLCVPLSASVWMYKGKRIYYTEFESQNQLIQINITISNGNMFPSVLCRDPSIEVFLELVNVIDKLEEIGIDKKKLIGDVLTIYESAKSVILHDAVHRLLHVTGQITFEEETIKGLKKIG